MKTQKIPPYEWPVLLDYYTKNIEYKDQALQRLTDEMGFEPALRASIIQQTFLRGSLKRFDEGALRANQLEHHIKEYCRIIRNWIPEKAPHQIPLLKKHPTGYMTVIK